MPENPENPENPESPASTGTEETVRLGTEETPRTGSEDTGFLGQWQHEPAEPVEPFDNETDERHRGFHPLQTGYLVVGLLALGIALMWLLTDQGVMEVADGSVAFSIVLVTAGAVGLIASLGKALRRH